VVGYYLTNTAIMVFYNILGRLSGCCFLKLLPAISIVFYSVGCSNELWRSSSNVILYPRLLVRSVDLLATAVGDVCVVMRHEGKGTGHIDRQCMVHTACP